MRADSQFRSWVTADGSAGVSGSASFKAEAGRYHLFVSYNCPWAHRTIIFRKLKQLEGVIRSEAEPGSGGFLKMPKIGMPKVGMPKLGMPKIGMPKLPAISMPSMPKLPVPHKSGDDTGVSGNAGKISG